MRQRLAIITECARRVAPMYALWAIFVVMFAWFRQMAAADGVDLAMGRSDNVVAWSMTATWLVAMMATGHLQRREFNQLPASRRDLWVSRWWLSVVAPGTVAAVGTAGSEIITHYPSLSLASVSHIVLATLCCATWGAVSMMMQRTQWLEGFKFLDRLPPHSKARRYLASFVIVWVLAWVFGGIGLPFVLAPVIIAIVATPTAGTYVLAVLAAAVVLAQYFHQPPVKARPPVARVVRRDTTAEPSPTATPSRSSSVSGVSFMYWREVRKCLWTLGIAAVAIVSYWSVFESTQPLVEFLGRYWLLPFDRAGADTPLWFFFLFPALAPQSDDIRREIRRLRTLPFSARSLSHALMIRVLIGPIALWIAGLVLHITVLRSAPSHLHLGALVVLMGVLAMMHAVNLAIAGRRWAKAATIIGLAGCGFIVARVLGSDAHPNVAVIGWVLLVGAQFLSQWAIRKQTALYSRYDGPLVATERFS